MLRRLEQFPVRRGAHDRRSDGMCTMEMVAWLAGEDHSDEPQCACPVIAAYVRALNDGMPTDASRNRLLRPLVPDLVGTRGSAADERRRGFQVADAMVRTFVPHLLDKRQRRDEAAALRALPAVVDAETARAALRAIEHWAGDQHAARWVLQRAIEDGAPARWVAGAVQIVRRAGDPAAWQLASELARSLAGVVVPESAPASVN
jgi:hypothetical protein